MAKLLDGEDGRLASFYKRQILSPCWQGVMAESAERVVKSWLVFNIPLGWPRRVASSAGSWMSKVIWSDWHHDQIVQRYYQASPIQFGGSITDDAVTSKARSPHPNFDFGSIFDPFSTDWLHRMMIEVFLQSPAFALQFIYKNDPEWSSTSL